MSEGLSKEQKKNKLKEIILSLHQGLPVEKAKERFEKEVGKINSLQIAELEQALIDEGMSPDEIKKFCNVHALLFGSSLEQNIKDPDYAGHPVNLFKSENREIEKRLNRLKEFISNESNKEFAVFKEEFKELLEDLNGIRIHYNRKEHLLFPLLEKHGFSGPSKVMWDKDNEIKELLNTSISRLDKTGDFEQFKKYSNDYLNTLLEEIDGMIFKEENILFPTALEKFKTKEWEQVLKDSKEIGYTYIKVPEEMELPHTESDTGEINIDDFDISMPAGKINVAELVNILTTLPVDMTFIGEDDTVRFFSDNKDRVFPRPKSIIGLKVQNCHPSHSIHAVEDILNSFKNGSRDSVDFWIKIKDKFIYIRYFAMRDKEGKYLGTLEVTQDITEIRKLEGEKRLLDERD